MQKNQSLQLENISPLKYSNASKTPVPVPGPPTGVNEDDVNGVTVMMWCNRALGGLTLHTLCVSTHNRHLLQNCQLSPSLLCYLWEMKSTAEINCCSLPAMGEEGNPSLNESFLRIIFVWSGFYSEGLKNILQNGSEVQTFAEEESLFLLILVSVCSSSPKVCRCNSG